VPAMYAVIDAGSKQAKVAEGETVLVERLEAPEGSTVELRPVLVVDGSTVRASADALASVRVEAEVLGEARGPKVRGFTYKSKTNQRRRFGHRQRYTRLRITGIVVDKGVEA
jgi:large subunit ribosomal protein L21